MIKKFNIASKRSTQILLAPLDWGLGHATRCVPIIKYLLENGCEITIAAEGKQLALLQQEFPLIQTVHLRGYRLRFSTNRWKTIAKIIAQIPKIRFAARREHLWLKHFSKNKRFDAIISDNRYGFFLNDVTSIFITHQLTIKTPFGKTGDRLIRFINFKAINNFNCCWVPDGAGSENLGGDLSHPPILPGLPVHYIGPLSRFSPSSSHTPDNLLLIVLSGPEPQRTLLEAILLKQLPQLSHSSVLVRGLPGEEPALPDSHNTRIFNHLNAGQLQHYVQEAAIIISRPGYSSVMDMLLSGKKCIFIPTPGQTEQEYLADYLAGKEYCIAAKQSGFSLALEMEKLINKELEKFTLQAGPDEKTMKSFLEGIKLPGSL